MLPSINQRPERKSYDKILYEQHIERLKNMLPTIDNSTPRQHPYNTRRLRERIRHNNKIERENCQILQNIALAIQKTNIDNTLSKHVQTTRRFKKHLSYINHVNKLRKITNENFQLLRRIQNVPPSIHLPSNV